MEIDDATSQGRRLTRAEARARTRERLLDAAAQVIARKGFAGASVEEIAESAGYSTGALYSNFDSKEQLFLELLLTRRSQGTAVTVTAVADILGNAEAASEDQLKVLSKLFARVADADTETIALQAEFWLYAVRNPEAMGVVAAGMAEQVAALERLVIPAMERSGAAAGISPTTLTRAVLALFQGLVRQRRVDPAAVPDDLFAQVLQWLFAGLREAQ